MTNQLDCLLVSCLDIDIKNIQGIVDRFCENTVLQMPFSSFVAHVGTYLDKHGFTFDYVDYNTYNKNLETKLSADISCVAVSTTFLEDAGKLVEIIQFIRQCNANCKIAVGGIFITRALHEYRDESYRNVMLRKINADFYIDSNYGEDILAALIDCLKRDKDYKKIPNLYSLENNQYVCHAHIQQQIHLREHMVNWELFRKDLGMYIPLRTSISCLFNCAFCSFPVNGGAYQTLSSDEIFMDLKALSQIGSVKILNFIDDSFNMPYNHFNDILNVLINGQYNFQWHSFFRCGQISDDIAEKMKRSGCMGVMMGIESASPEMLKNMNKHINLNTAKQVFKILKKADIVTYAMFIVGFPGETEATINQTIDFINEAKPDFYALSPWNYNTEAPIYNQRKKYGLFGQGNNWHHNTMHSGEIQQYILKIYQNVRNSTMLAFNYTFLFQLLYQNISISKILDINNEKSRQILQSIEKPTFK